MYYHVCVQNCIEDFYSENQYCGKFETIEAAIEYVQSESVFPVFDVNGYIKWYFRSCDSDGTLKNPSLEDDVLECYQLVNIIPSEEEKTWIDESYGNDPRAVYEELRPYTLWYTGDYEF